MGRLARSGVAARTIASRRARKSSRPFRCEPSRRRSRSWTRPLSFAAERPADAIPGRGGVDVTLQARARRSPRRRARLHGAVSVMSASSSSCRRPSRCETPRRGRAGWTSCPAYLDRDGLLKYFASDWIEGDDTLTAYVLAIADEAGYAVPATEQQTNDRAASPISSRGDRAFGRRCRHGGPQRSASWRRSKRCRATTPPYRACSTASAIDPNLWPTSAVIDWLGILKRDRSDAQTRRAHRGAQAHRFCARA